MVSFVGNVQYCMHVTRLFVHACVWQVFLRETERQRLQDLLHQEVLRRIINLQRRFRALLERRNFLRMRQAASQIQVPLRFIFLMLCDNNIF